ncbi:hypothetical protein HAV1_gp31 [Hyperthermophilic Archaeal Virus 1]|uniref:hypothetical protein n=1 Tax=Hyperthermophilic Archaeal Virus 1 TaxID=762905 RepID=UPI0001DBAE0A|nr:hypothetical protein HAV1_gp31 [Hyperthermophilic Archaeal Virus 1]ADJ54254.1 hypothetical protein HAV1_gp31 [Hyperthermophilic Archaeal Virus 1]
MPIPKSDYEVVMDIPQWLLKKMVKVDPSPIAGGDGEGVYYVGKFSDTWAPEDLRNRVFYYLHAKSILSPDIKPANTTPQCLSGDNAYVGDPLFDIGATSVSLAFFQTFCAPAGATANWSSCLDPQFESGGTCYSSSTIGSVDYSKCVVAASTYYGPYMFIHNVAPASNTDITSVTAFSRPCPVYSSAYALSGKTETSGKLLIRAVGCDDSSNKVKYVRYTSEDRNPTSYTIAYIGLGIATSASGVQHWFRYALPSSVTKSSTDYYYYIYTIGFQYQ